MVPSHLLLRTARLQLDCHANVHNLQYQQLKTTSCLQDSMAYLLLQRLVPVGTMTWRSLAGMKASALKLLGQPLPHTGTSQQQSQLLSRQKLLLAVLPVAG